MKFLITGAWQGAAQHIPEIEALGHEVVFMQQEKDALPTEAGTVEGIIGNGIFLYHPMETFTSLHYVQLTSAGFDRVPMEYAAAHGITVLNARGVYSVPMAEYAVAGVLALYKKMFLFHNKQKAHLWQKERDLPELSGRTAAVFGCGSVGRECAKRFSAFGMKVVGVASSPGRRPYFEEVFAADEAETVLAGSDVVICALPLLPETEHFFDGKRFAAMKDGAVFVNISRGRIADTGALMEALAGGKLAGAVLDVFEDEPLAPESPLWDTENVIITPHNSFSGEGNRRRLWELIFDNLRKYDELHCSGS